MVKHPNGTIEHKIASAYYLKANCGQVLLRDKKVKTMLLQLNRNIETTWREMASVGVVRECEDCAVNGGGSCCGAGMENRYDASTLLINLLLGKHLSTREYDPDSCFFLSDQGCVLRAREVICVNYLCQRIFRNIQLDKLIHLQKIAGEELNTLFILQGYIKKKIQQLEKCS